MASKKTDKVGKQSRPSQTSQSSENALKVELEYLACGGWRPTVENLLHLLRSFRRFDSANLLERQMRDTSNQPSLDEEGQALSSIRTELATLTRQSKPDLSDSQKAELRKLLDEAIRLTTARWRAIPQERDSTKKAERTVARWLAEHPNLGAAEEAERDDSAYRPAKEFLGTQFPTHKRVLKALKDNPGIRRKWPRKNRLLIHIGDWLGKFGPAIAEIGSTGTKKGPSGFKSLDERAEIVKAFKAEECERHNRQEQIKRENLEKKRMGGK